MWAYYFILEETKSGISNITYRIYTLAEVSMRTCLGFSEILDFWATDFSASFAVFPDLEFTLDYNVG